MTGSKTTLPVHPIPATAMSWDGLAVCGLVCRPVQFDLAALAALPRATLVDDFACIEGWRVPGLQWEGPLLETLVDQALPQPIAQYVTVSSGSYVVSLPLADVLAGVGLLALRINGEPVPVEHGGPARLVVPGEACFTSVKWVKVIELTNQPHDTARDIALSRLAERSEDRLMGNPATSPIGLSSPATAPRSSPPSGQSPRSPLLRTRQVERVTAWPAHKLPTAVRAYGSHGLGTSLAKGALIATDELRAVIGQPSLTALTGLSHL